VMSEIIAEAFAKHSTKSRLVNNVAWKCTDIYCITETMFLEENRLKGDKYRLICDEWEGKSIALRREDAIIVAFVR
jgi:hypothetical protein